MVIAGISVAVVVVPLIRQAVLHMMAVMVEMVQYVSGSTHNEERSR